MASRSYPLLKTLECTVFICLVLLLQLTFEVIKYHPGITVAWRKNAVGLCWVCAVSCARRPKQGGFCLRAFVRSMSRTQLVDKQHRCANDRQNVKPVSIINRMVITQWSVGIILAPGFRQTPRKYPQKTTRFFLGKTHWKNSAKNLHQT